MEDKKRLFFSLPLPERVGTYIDDFARSTLKAYAAEIRMVPRANRHITLLFLGSCDSDTCDSLRATQLEFRPYRVQLDVTRIFPSSRNPRALCVSLSLDEAIHTLRSGLAKRCGISESGPFIPHITLAYLRRNAKPPLRSFQEQRVEALTAEGHEIQLQESVLDPGGARYSLVASWSALDTAQYGDVR